MSALEYDFTQDVYLNKTVEDFPEEYFSMSMQYKKTLRPDWWKAMSLFAYGYNNVAELLKNKFDDIIKEDVNSYRTVKTCPGLGAVFNRAINLKWPCDVLIQVDEEGNLAYKTSNDTLISLGIHQQKFQGHLDDVIFLKVTYPIAIRNKNFDVSFHDPILYNNTPFRVSPGLLLRSKRPITLSSFLIFPAKPENYFFKAGEVFTTLVLSESGIPIKKANLYNDVMKYRSDISSSFFDSKWSKRNVDNG